jgi:hypothetical protein
MTEPVNTPPNLFLTPANWTEGVYDGVGGDSPPVWWNAEYTYWNFYAGSPDYPHTIIYTGATALPVGQVIFEWTVEEAAAIPFWFVYRFTDTDPFTIVPIPQALSGTGEIAVFLPGGQGGLEGQQPYFEWGVFNTSTLPTGTPSPVTRGTLLLMHCDGTNDSTNFIDSSLYHNVITPANGAVISTAQTKFGTGAAYLSSVVSTDLMHITVPIVPGEYMDILSGSGEQDFTIEFWVYSDFVDGVWLDYGDIVNESSNYGSGTTGIYLVLSTGASGLQVSPSIPGWSTISGPTATVNASAWNHVAIVRHNFTAKAYLNGSSVGGVSAGNWRNFSMPAGTPGVFSIGDSVQQAGGLSAAYYDEIRVSNYAVYTADFTPPTAPFANPVDDVFQSGEVAVTAYSDAFNCECDSEASNYATLAELRTRMMYRLGYAAQANNPPPGMVGLLNEFLQDAQRLLYRSYKELRTERFFSWTMGVGQRYYGISDNENGCVLPFDPYKVTWVGFEDLNQAWYPLTKGINPVLYTRAQITLGWPTAYEIRSCIEIFPAPRANYTLWVKAHFVIQPFTEDDDQTTIDDEAVFLMALGNAKAHYKQADSAQVLGQALSYVRNLVAGTHQTARYVPRTRIEAPMTPPRFLPLEP